MEEKIRLPMRLLIAELPRQLIRELMDLSQQIGKTVTYLRFQIFKEGLNEAQQAQWQFDPSPKSDLSAGYIFQEMLMPSELAAAILDLVNRDRPQSLLIQRLLEDGVERFRLERELKPKRPVFVKRKGKHRLPKPSKSN